MSAIANYSDKPRHAHAQNACPALMTRDDKEDRGGGSRQKEEKEVRTQAKQRNRRCGGGFQCGRDLLAGLGRRSPCPHASSAAVHEEECRD
eukprot:2576020-Pleurochrysis_carterae.AAC.1